MLARRALRSQLLWNQVKFASSSTNLQKTPLHNIHLKYKAKMGDFCGWDMPFTYPTILSDVDSHLHTRKKASLFDVSHMLRLTVEGKDSVAFLEKLFVADAKNLEQGTAAYTLLMNEQGGIVDDAILAKCDGYFYLVLNAGCAEKDLKFLNEQKSGFDVKLTIHDGALVAIQGPTAHTVLKSVADPATVDALYFMNTNDNVQVAGTKCRVTRCGYTGEDGFEIEIRENVEQVVDALLSHEALLPAGLVSRDTLRLEAGLALYGNDLTEEISPVAAGLTWPVPKSRRKDAGFNGAQRFLTELKNGVDKKRVGITAPRGRILRPGMDLYEADGTVVGKLCSGGFSPCLDHSIGMAYVNANKATLGTKMNVKFGEKVVSTTVAKMPFVPTSYRIKK